MKPHDYRDTQYTAKKYTTQKSNSSSNGFKKSVSFEIETEHVIDYQYDLSNGAGDKSKKRGRKSKDND